MKFPVLNRWPLSIGAAAALSAGCGGSQPPIGAPGAMALGQSLVRPDAHGKDLLYVSTVNYQVNYTYVYTYPGSTPVGVLSNYGPTGDLCSNKSGNVFITTQAAIYEYPHGRSAPVAILGNGAQSCSVDPTTGDLASNYGNTILVYSPGSHHRWHIPRLFTLSNANTTYACAYDADGNLFADGQTYPGFKPLFVELPKGGSSFKAFTLNKRVSSPGSIQWDGRYLAIGDQNNTAIRRFAISGTSGRQVGVLTLAGASGVDQFWIQGNTVVGTAYENPTKPAYFIGLWQYPSGKSSGEPISEQYHMHGATVSVARD